AAIAPAPALPPPPPAAVAERPSAAGPPRPVEPASYDKVVAEGDRLLQRGGRERARKLYDQALKARPNGGEGRAGLGYVSLDRGRNDRARVYFERAVAGNGSYGPALFGLAEAYRGDGDDELALEHYRRYLAVDPKGVDVGPAERQIQALEARLAARAAGG